MNQINRIQAALKERKLDAVLIIDEKNQRYALGFPFTDGAVLISQERAWLITDSRYVEAAALAVGGLAEVLVFDARRSLSETVRQLVQRAGLRRLGLEEEKLSHGAFLRWQQALGCEMIPVQAMFDALRAVKSEEELASMRLALKFIDRYMLV